MIADAFEACSIVVIHEAIKEGVTIGMAGKGTPGNATFRFATDGFGDATVEALDKAVGLRPIRSGQAMIDVVGGTDHIERMTAGRAAGWLVLHIDGKAVGKLGAIVAQDGVDAMREVGQESIEEAGRGSSIAPAMDLDIDVAGGAIDGDEGVTFASLQGRQMLQVEVNEADSGLFKDADSGLLWPFALTDAAALQAAMDGAAGQLSIDATPHHLNDIVERQLKCCPQFADQRLFHCRQVCGQPDWPVRSIGDRCPVAPATDRGLADAKFDGQLRNRLLALLDVAPDFWSCRGIGVQIQFHDARRSPRYAMPWSTPIPSTQSPGTKHVRRDDADSVSAHRVSPLWRAKLSLFYPSHLRKWEG